MSLLLIQNSSERLSLAAPDGFLALSAASVGTFSSISYTGYPAVILPLV
jgi:hypothetical protein